MQKVSITTQRLIIRNLGPEDLNDFYIYRSNPDVTRFQGFDVMTLNEAGGFITEQKDKQFGKAGEWVQYGIESKTTKNIIGDCAVKLQESDVRIAEVGITISHLHQKKGFAKEALAGILTFLFTENNVHRVVAIVDVENTASIRLLKSSGFIQEGHFVENIFFKGKWGSEFQFAMFARNWAGDTSVDQQVTTTQPL